MVDTRQGHSPDMLVGMSADKTMSLLKERLGQRLDEIIAGHPFIPTPLDSDRDSGWLKSANIVGVNVRTIGSFWNLVKYSLSLSPVQNAVHLLPIWEPGVVGSLYGMASWKINSEFFSTELAFLCPALDDADKQLALAIDLLHALGIAVGMDVVPHTDRFSEMVLACPGYFEWLRREDTRIIDHRADLHVEVEKLIHSWLLDVGPALESLESPRTPGDLFCGPINEDLRLRLLFGEPSDRSGRDRRRLSLVRLLHDLGYETVPATMAPPYRGLLVDKSPEALHVDASGLSWRDYLLENPGPMSRVFGPLTRYKLYERIDDNVNWKIDFDRPRRDVWKYVCDRYSMVQERFGFDFMRGDMSHVQMRPQGVPQEPGRYYDILGAVKRHIRQRVASFAYLAESFLAPRGVMAYGDEVDHLESVSADAVLGDLQSSPVESAGFLARFRRYHDIASDRRVTPCFTIITADKDDPRFDDIYLAANELRLFTGLFLGDMPSYMSLGFELRDHRLKAAANEYYSKYYVFRQGTGEKKTSGPFRWGTNRFLYRVFTRMCLCLERYWRRMAGARTRWLLAPDPTGGSPLYAWTQQEDPVLLCIANTGIAGDVENIRLPSIESFTGLVLEFCSKEAEGGQGVPSSVTLGAGGYFHLESMAAGECRAYRIVRTRQVAPPRKKRIIPG